MKIEYHGSSIPGLAFDGSSFECYTWCIEKDDGERLYWRLEKDLIKKDFIHDPVGFAFSEMNIWLHDHV